MSAAAKPLQGSLFEEDFLVRTLGAISNEPDIALTELLANAWDAGASRVEITIPGSHGDELVVEDDGAGMTREQFLTRWMTLGYDRTKHQGLNVQFPPGRQGQRRAYGKNGVGRHGMLCFANEYIVETRVDGAGQRFRVAATSGKEPFALLSAEPFASPGYGTRLLCNVVRHLPDATRIRHLLSARFLYDPAFTVRVNGKAVPLHQHEGFIEKAELQLQGGLVARVTCIDSTKGGRTGQQHGVAFWVGGRLVGEPSWTVGGEMVLDGRTNLAKRITIVVQLPASFGDIEADWARFKATDRVRELNAAVANYVRELTGRLLADRIEETSVAVLSDNKVRLGALQPLAKVDVASFAQEVARIQPTISQESLSAAVQAVMHLEETRSGKALLVQLSELSPEDVEGLTRLLREWTVRDALTVLDEIGKRIRVVEALEKLSKDPSVDEVSTIHPLVSQARWLFGPEFESPLFAWNITIRRVVEKLWGKSVPPTAFVNPKNRPDLVFLEDRTVAGFAVESPDGSSEAQLVALEHVLLIELKRGGSTIERKEVDQTVGYVEDFLGPNVLDGNPKVRAFVVGHEVDARIQKRSLGERGVVEAVTFERLIRTAGQRLFRLRDQVQDRYDGLEGASLLQRLEAQGDLFVGEKPSNERNVPDELGSQPLEAK